VKNGQSRKLESDNFGISEHQGLFRVGRRMKILRAASLIDELVLIRPSPRRSRGSLCQLGKFEGAIFICGPPSDLF
jgi:hypothetical protein